MGKTRKIPVVKNRVNIDKRKPKSGFVQAVVICVVLVGMLLFVWLKVQTNLLLAQIQVLETELNRGAMEQEKLQAEVVRLSSFGRIQKIAQDELGLDFLSHEQIIEIAKNSKD